MLFSEVFVYFPEDFPVLKTAMSAFVSFVLGLVWYNPTLVGKKVAESIEFNPAIHHYFIAAILWAISACVYSFLIGFLTPPTIGELLGMSTFLWVGFILPAVMMNGMFSGKKLSVMGVDSSYFLAALYLMAVIHDVL
jgi:hypothetical protein